jgi:hypothetical protein
MEQARLLAQMPEFIVRATARQIMFDTDVIHSVTGKLFPQTWSDEEDAKIKAERDLRIAALPEEIEIDQKDINHSVRMLTALCSQAGGHEHILTAIEAMLVALLLQAWTAFESFAADVWVAALNANPKKFAKRVAGAKPSAGASSQEKSVHVSSLEKFDFNLTNSMGTLLKDKFDFARLSNIKNAYVAAFGDEAKLLFDTSFLNCANIAALQAVRNVYAHRGGKADVIFRSAISKCAASPYHGLATLEDGKKIEVDGIMVRELFVSTCMIALALLRFVKGKL